MSSQGLLDLDLVVYMKSEFLGDDDEPIEIAHLMSNLAIALLVGGLCVHLVGSPVLVPSMEEGEVCNGLCLGMETIGRMVM
ncbi:uncharacterized protein N7487_003223 [Penicillium crustosum]|uniref:uncharacterized protein n=1 Tax=Penicillium crustosum TaxID=36656 RepID=UPI0023908F3C|nr:uncharacterized protein N7487_003223 [Penicillium crustosum]KAJ5419673.1 hypothetical protein N7487_003223 [Penicillium crustosum]